MKDLSCGVIIADNEKHLLAIVPWGKKNSLDIPKGHIDPGESPIECALRELREETSIKLKASDLKDLGKFYYSTEKDLHLFLCKVTSMPNPLQLKCNSTFTNAYGKVVPEATAFQITSFDDPRFYASLKPILFLIQKSL